MSSDTFFTCRETPVYCPSGLTLADIPGSQTTQLRISAQLAGPGHYTGPYNDYYYNINENPTTALHLNGVMYNLVDSVLTFPGVHVVAGFSKVCDAEILLKFQPSQTNVLGLPPILVCIPVQSGVRLAPTAVRYFATLGTGPTSGRPTIADILPRGATYLNYQGFSVWSLLDSAKCSTLSGSQTLAQYIVCQVPIGMTQADFERFRAEIPMNTPPAGSGLAPTQKVLPPVPSAGMNRSRFIKQTTRITDVRLDTGDPAPGLKKHTKGIPVPSLKCQPVKLKGATGKLSMDMTGRQLTTTLDAELNATHAEIGDDPGAGLDGKCTQQAGDTEWILSSVLGMFLAVAIISLITWLVYKNVFTNYLNVVSRSIGNWPKVQPLNLGLPSLCKSDTS
jgi:hypothetical protein